MTKGALDAVDIYAQHERLHDVQHLPPGTRSNRLNRRMGYLASNRNFKPTGSTSTPRLAGHAPGLAGKLRSLSSRPRKVWANRLSPRPWKSHWPPSKRYFNSATPARLPGRPCQTKGMGMMALAGKLVGGTQDLESVTWIVPGHQFKRQGKSRGRLAPFRRSGRDATRKRRPSVSRGEGGAPPLQYDRDSESLIPSTTPPRLATTTGRGQHAAPDRHRRNRRGSDSSPLGRTHPTPNAAAMEEPTPGLTVEFGDMPPGGIASPSINARPHGKSQDQHADPQPPRTAIAPLRQLVGRGPAAGVGGARRR